MRGDTFSGQRTKQIFPEGRPWTFVTITVFTELQDRRWTLVSWCSALAHSCAEILIRSYFWQNYNLWETPGVVTSPNVRKIKNKNVFAQSATEYMSRRSQFEILNRPVWKTVHKIWKNFAWRTISLATWQVKHGCMYLACHPTLTECPYAVIAEKFGLPTRSYFGRTAQPRGSKARSVRFGKTAD